MYRILSIASILGVLVFSSASLGLFGQIHSNGSAGLNELHVPSEYPTIQTAIDAAVDGDTIIVAPGTYTGDGNRDIDLKGKAITVRSADPNDPNIVAATVIDCNGSESEPHRGFYFHNGEDANSIVDGLTITNGYVDAGGAIYCNASNPAVKNCIFFKNSYAVRGGAIYCLRSNITIENCVFTKNSASQGGGLFCYANSPTITNCTFTENSANSLGGGMFNQYSSPAVKNCIFTKNVAKRGGGMENFISNPTITNCIFTENSAVVGGGLSCFSGSPTIANCSFIENYAEQDGGGIYNYYLSNPMITNCIFTENVAEQFNGGGIYNFESSPVISNCIFFGNSASPSYGSGGAISISDGNSIITNSSIVKNTARFGGGVSNVGGNLTLTNCTFSGNSAYYDGGGLYNGVYDSDNNLALTNCTFSSNSAGYYGGGMSDAFSNTKLTNCTFYANSAQLGGGMDVYDSTITASNCILWADVPREIYLWVGTVTISYSDVKDGWRGTGNINTDPCFVNPDSNDFHLLPNSPCINAGDPCFLPEPNETDIDGLPRVIGSRVDMGAYEFNHQPIAIAGPNQVVHAWIDGFADVNLDGSASCDDDNDVLDYYWSWTVKGSDYEANGVTPTIQLPLGTHNIELIVDDGIDLSEPDYCTIKVLRAIRGRLILSPRVIETRSCGKWILATLFIPPVPGERVNKNEPLRLYPSGIEAKYQRFSKFGMFPWSPTIAVAYFDKQQVTDALGIGQFNVNIVGEFLSGRFFFGSDSIRIISHNPKPPPHWH